MGVNRAKFPLLYLLHLRMLYITTIATQMPRFKLRQDSEAEKRISLVLNLLYNEERSIRAAGRKYGVPKTTLTNWYYGRAKPKTEAHIEQQLLTVEEENAIEA